MVAYRLEEVRNLIIIISFSLSFLINDQVLIPINSLFFENLWIYLLLICTQLLGLRSVFLNLAICFSTQFPFSSFILVPRSLYSVDLGGNLLFSVLWNYFPTLLCDICQLLLLMKCSTAFPLNFPSCCLALFLRSVSWWF